MPKIILHILICLLLSSTLCCAADVLIIADAQLKPVKEISQGMRKSLRASIRTYSPTEIKGNLAGIVQQENARLVIALGREALAEALTLPSHTPVIYGLVVTPPVVSRPNTTGFYMATPVEEYAEFIRKYLPAFKRVAVAGGREMLNILASNVTAPLSNYSVKNSFEFIKTINQLDRVDALLLLPDSNIMTSTAMEEAFLFSFRRRVPLLGFSERHVKEGALLALVVDVVNMGRVIGEHATKSLKNSTVGQQQALPPRKFDLYLNMDTARKMRINIPDEVVRLTRKAYP